MIQIGFSYIGLIWIIMLWTPRFVRRGNMPSEHSKAFIFCERLGLALVTVIALIFKNFNIDINRKPASVFLIISFLLMACYEFFAVFKGISADGTVCSVLSLMLLAIYGSNSFLMIATVIYGIGRIGMRVRHKKAAILGCAFALLLTDYFGIKNFLFIKAFAGADNPVNEECFINLNGQNQFIRVLGRNDDNPVIIILHGGPGSPDGMFDYAFMDHVIDDYTYITWDQRGCGRTYYHNYKIDPDNNTLTENQLLEDIDSLVKYASDRFGKDKVILLGHSWGSRLAVRYSLLHPDKIDKTVCIGQLVNFSEGAEAAYDHAYSEALKRGDDVSALKQAFENLKSDPDLSALMKLRSLSAPYNTPNVKEKAVLYGAFSPYLGLEDVKWLIKDCSSVEKVYRHNSVLFDYMFKYEAGSFGIEEFGINFEVPVYFISGRMDWTCPTGLAKEYYEKITAPDKAFFEIEGCGHTPQGDKPEEVAEIIKKVLQSADI